MKIHIIGGPGSGKTFLAEKLSKELGVQHYDLDYLQWDNQSDSYGVKRAPDERDDLLADILNHKTRHGLFALIKELLPKWVSMKSFSNNRMAYIHSFTASI